MLKIIRRVLRLSGQPVKTDLGQLFLRLFGIHVWPAANRCRIFRIKTNYKVALKLPARLGVSFLP